eukprot:22147_5
MALPILLAKDAGGYNNSFAVSAKGLALICFISLAFAPIPVWASSVRTDLNAPDDVASTKAFFGFVMWAFPAALGMDTTLLV